MPQSEAKRAGELEERALALRTLGWLLLVFTGSITVLWIWVGLRDGSDLWLILAATQGVVGLGLVAGGVALESRAIGMAGKEAEPHAAAGTAEERKAA